MTEITKTLVIRALSNYRGDNYERAKRRFAGLSPDQMRRQWGESGQTCQEILDGYRQHAESVEAAIAEVRGL